MFVFILIQHETAICTEWGIISQFISALWAVVTVNFWNFTPTEEEKNEEQTITDDETDQTDVEYQSQILILD